MRDAIQGMLSMSQMGRQSNQLLQSQQPVKYYSDDIEEQLNSCYKDDEFVYPSLVYSDSDDDMKLHKKSKSDEAWNPKGSVRVNRDGSHADRPRRLGAKKEAIENNLAEAAARLSSSPNPSSSARKHEAGGTHTKFGNSHSPKQNISPASCSFKAKPKKGMATTKQRLAHKLKLKKSFY